MAANSIVSLPTTDRCQNDIIPLAVEITNESRIQAIDFSVNPATVTVNVTGAITQTISFIVEDNSLNNGNPLAMNASLEVPVGTLNLSTAGSYSFAVSVSVTGDGEPSNDAGTPGSVMVNALPLVVANASSTLICDGTPLTLNASGANTYTWDNGAPHNTAFNISAPTVFTVTGIDVNGCQNTARYQWIFI